ncbi:hypothetical protein E3O62_06780 [Cryobacterium sp. TMT2-15-1]|uniref:hypothetical protein n=1 Tax=Cryobacterium sp. TMT2-15-1 TaxID=1259246 RepID=UPI001069055C|nr:hypothetical protein [Cryobacterium sp. TMT2-15-1]TFC60403.1 hypothetical protein E3O62_06780 [Cryobacterium sp. TMT2-15-1]
MSDTTSPEGNRNRNHDNEPEPVDYAGHEERTDAPDYSGTGSHSAPAASGDAHEPTTGSPASYPAEPVGEPVSYDAPDASREPATPAYVPAASVNRSSENTTAETQRLEPVEHVDERPVATQAVTQTANPADAPPNTTAQPPVYIQAPTAPRYKSNRGPGVLIALLSTVIFGALYAVVAFVLSGIGSLSIADTASKFTDFIVLPIFYVPVIFFFVAFALLVLIVNRGGWWAYVLFGFLVAVAVYFSYIGAALLSVQAWNFTPDQAARFISQQWLNPGAIAAAVVAREVPIWAGAWIARNGRAVTERNTAAKAEYDRVLAAGPQGIRSN